MINAFNNNYKQGDKFTDKIIRLKNEINGADAIIVGAGAGLSTSAGYEYSGDRFKKYFLDFSGKYGFQDAYAGGFYPYSTPEETWAFWSRYIFINRYMCIPKPDVYTDLLNLVKDKDYFVITTNVDHCFQRSGFDKNRLFYTQGDYGLFQCSEPCHRKTYVNDETVRKMVVSQGYSINGDILEPPSSENGEIAWDHLKMTIPSDLVPFCPVCGKPMSMNLRSDGTFVEDEGWHEAAGRYGDYLASHGIKSFGYFTSDSDAELFREYNGKILFWELGVGFNTPGIIKYPFWKMTKDSNNSFYACINMDEEYIPNEISDRSVYLNGDIGEIIKRLGSIE
jgi:NAD-dependent SIR2 family protein deacetylase